MSKRNDLMKQEELLEKILAMEKRIEKAGKTSAAQQKQLNKMYQESFKIKSADLDLGKKIENFNKSSLGKAVKKLGIDKQINNLASVRENGTKKDIKNADKLFSIMEGIADGTKSFSDGLSEIGEGDFGKLNDQAVDFGRVLKGNKKELEESIQKSKKIGDNFDSVLESITGIDIEQTLSAAGALAIIGSFANKTLEIKQSLGTSAGESARLVGNMTAAGIQAKLLGGSSEQAEAAVTAMVDEFGSLSVVSLETSLNLGKMIANTGLTGANAAKLLSSMQSISGASIETNIALIQSTKELARAAGVAPAQVLNDIAENTELFAEFAKDGGKNIGAAAIQARKLGLNLGTVASIAEKLLDFESSIESSMEASVMLGRQVNTDKARELALSGDLKGMAEEIKKQVGSQAEFEAMNVAQRQSLAKAMGVTVSDLGKIIRGEQTSADIAEEKQKAEASHMNLEKMAMIAQIGGLTTQIAMQGLLNKKRIIGAIASIFSGNGRLGPAGIIAALGGIATMYSMMPKANTGGTVRETGMAVIHKGETISGTAGQFGGETNKLIKQLISQNEVLMNRLTTKVSDLALS
jgi:hypothetical protein